MEERKENIKKIENIIEAFSELTESDIEEAKAALIAAGKDPDLILQKGIRKLRAIQKKAAYKKRLSDSKNTKVNAGDGISNAFPLVLFDKDSHEVILSDHIYNERIMHASEVYNVLVKKCSLENVAYNLLIIDDYTSELNIQRILKEISFTATINSDRATLCSEIEGTGYSNLRVEDVNLIIRTGYYISEKTCFLIDQDSLDFAIRIMAQTNNSFTLPINVALTYFSKPQASRYIRFTQKEFDIHEVITSDLYSGASDLFIKELYNYQKEGLNWLMYCCINRLGGILADDMGLGKTAQIIALIAAVIERNILGNILIVVPSTLMENWRREFDFFAPLLKPYLHHGNRRTGSPAFLGEKIVVITSYSLVVNDFYLFDKINWGLTILDEASLVKNPESERRAALIGLYSEVRIAMTGTPVENSLIDLWSIADYVNRDYLGSKEEFSKKYVSRDIEASLEGDNLVPLRKEISYIMLRRRKEDVLDSLPDKIDIHQALCMNEAEATIYEEKRIDILSQVTEVPAGKALKLIMELRMFTTHPLLKKPEELKKASLAELMNSSLKFRRTIELLNEIRIKKEKVIIFTEYLSMIDILKKVLSSYYSVEVLTIDGRIIMQERQKNIDRFSASEGFNIMALNPKTAGMGLNITAANHVIHYTRQWNPALEEQASARSYRNGQKKGVNVYYLFYIDTIEEIIDERLRSKTALSKEVISITETEEGMDQYLTALYKSPIK